MIIRRAGGIWLEGLRRVSFLVGVILWLELFFDWSQPLTGVIP